MEVVKTKLDGVLILKPRVFEDNRGFFIETFHAPRYQDLCGISDNFVQDNVSFSERGVLRGLHFQNPFPQGKLLTVLQGEIFDVAVDLRKASSTFGQAVSVTLSAQNHWQFWVPPGFAHGFCVVSPTALVSYKCTQIYHPETEMSLLWNDPALQISWPTLTAQVSEKDKKGLLLKDIPQTAFY